MDASEKTRAMDEIERRAREVRRTMSDVCERAGVSYSTWYRARQGHNEIKLKTIGSLEDALTAFEAERAAA
jgi:predicted transcriptional regulator